MPLKYLIFTVLSHKFIAIIICVAIAGGGGAIVYFSTAQTATAPPPQLTSPASAIEQPTPTSSQDDTASKSTPSHKSKASSSSPASATTSSPDNNTQSADDSTQSSSNGGDSGGSTTSGGTNDSGNTDGSDNDGGAQTPPPANTPPTAPTNAHVGLLQSDLVRIDCNRATDPDGIARHELLRDGVVVSSSTSTSAVVGLADSSPTPGQTYVYTVRAVDTLGAVGPESNSVTVTVPQPDTTPPSVPANFRLVSNTPGSITLAWDPSTDDTTTNANMWYVITSPLDESDFYTWTQQNPFTTSWFDQPGVTHEIYIQAIDLAGNKSAKAGPVTFVSQ